MISRVIVAAESVSALDVWVRGQVSDLLHELQEEMGSRISSSRMMWRRSSA